MSNQNNILNVFSEDENQVLYTINGEAKFGVNPSQSIVSAISKAVNVEKISSFRQSTIGGIFQSVLSKYITASVANNQTQLESFSLQLDKTTNDFCMSFNDGKHPGYTDEIRKDGYEISGAVNDDSFIIQAKQIELVDARNCYGKQIVPKFLEGDFRGEFISSTIVTSKNSGEVKMGSTIATRTEHGVEVSTACFNVSEDMTGTMDASLRESINFEKKDDLEGGVTVTEDEVSALNRAFSDGMHMAQNQLFNAGQQSSFDYAQEE